jgi:hypothetical protein
VNWNLETQHTVGQAMMATGAVLFVFIMIWAVSEWFGHPTWRDILAVGPLILMVSGIAMLAWAIRLA